VQRGTPANTFSTTPTRRFTFLFDPKYLSRLSEPHLAGIVPMVQALRNIDPPIVITFIRPVSLGEREDASYSARSVFSDIARDDDVPRITLSKDLSARHRRALSHAVDDRAVRLLSLSEFIQADGIITDEPSLNEARYKLLEHHQARIIPINECADWFEVCAHGHGVFWSTTERRRTFTVDLFYQWAHPKGRRLAKWFSDWRARLEARGIDEDIRNLILNRYPFLLSSRDMVRFYELQMAHFTRRGLQRRFSVPLGYYLSNFYLHLWGTLDHLTVVANKTLVLGLEQRSCGIESIRFWRAFGTKDRTVRAIMRAPKTIQWIDVMAHMRHAAAHRDMLLPTVLVKETDAYKKTDPEISAILETEDPDFYVGPFT
jgi:hypothetical protein